MCICGRVRGVDPDGDRLSFGSLGDDADLVRVVMTGSNEAEVILTRELDYEAATEYQILLSLTDGHLGQDNYITQPLLILVEDINDNVPVFTDIPHAVVVQEHQEPGVIARFRASDKDSGAFGQVQSCTISRIFYESPFQVIYQLAPNQAAEIIDNFSVSTVKTGEGVLVLLSELDYEVARLYQVQVEAVDRASVGSVNTAQATILVEVNTAL